VKLGEVAAVWVFQQWFLAFSSPVFLDFSKPDLYNFVAFFKTRAPQPCSLSSAAHATGSTGHADSQSLTRGLHAPESSLLFGAHDGHALPFSGRARWGWGIW